ncbi:MAG: FAD:protein FMN transferase [Candidatus Omnitrophota bacterium]
MTVFSAVLLALSGCVMMTGDAPAEYKETRLYYGTYVTIRCLYGEGTPISGIIARCWDEAGRIQTAMDVRSASGDVGRINASGGLGVRVGSGVYGLLKDSIEFSRLTGGAFDVTVYPLVEVWRTAARDNRLPDKAVLEEAKSKIGYQYVHLGGDNTVTLRKSGMKIDLGAIAKGYAVDRIARILSAGGIENFLVDAGGDIFCRGKNSSGSDWNVGIRDPIKAGGLIGSIRISGAAVTTSGDYERFYRIDGERFSHILNPATGYPGRTVISATVIAKTAEEADALATALCALEGEEGIRLTEKIDDVEAMVIEKADGELRMLTTEGFPDIKRKQ